MRTDYKDGWLAIREEDNWTDEPVKVITWWPIYQDSLASLNSMELLDKECTYEGSGVYNIRIAPYQYRRAALSQGGSTLPIATERVAIPAPKVRKGVQIRYRHGSWMKYLKSEGWVIA